MSRKLAAAIEKVADDFDHIEFTDGPALPLGWPSVDFQDDARTGACATGAAASASVPAQHSKSEEFEAVWQPMQLSLLSAL